MLVDKISSLMGWIVLAQEDVLWNLGARFRPEGSEIPTGKILLLAAVALTMGLALWGYSWWNTPQDRCGYSNFRQLFRQLCRLHGIDYRSRRLLGQLAKLHGLAHPAELFMMPERFEVTSLPPELKPFAPRIVELKQQIFDQPS